MTTGPRRWRTLLSRSLPPHDRDCVLHELDREFALISAERGPQQANRWYRRQVAASLLPALALRRRQMSITFEQARRDLFIAARRLARRPAFTAIAVTTCALGIGMSTAVFAVTDTIVFRPLAFTRPDQLVRIWSRNPKGILKASVSVPDFFDWRDHTSAFSSMALFTPGLAMTLRTTPPERVTVSTVTADFFRVLGKDAAMGRTFLGEDSAQTNSRFVVISDSCWRRYFGASPTVIGTSMTLDDAPRTILGVMPPDFQFPSTSVMAWVPVTDASRARMPRNARFAEAIGRLSGGETLDTAGAALSVTADQLAREYPADKGWGITVASLHDSIVGDVKRPLLMLLGSVACILLIACANVANLMLVRGNSREREVAVQAALGASRARLIREQLTESAVVGGVGGVFGVLLAAWGVSLVRSGVGIDLPRLASVHIDARVLAMAAATTMFTVLAAGVWPALRSARANAGPGLSANAARSANQGQGSRGWLASLEIAIALALLVTAGLLVSTFIRLRHVHAGFDAASGLVADVQLPFTQPETQWTPILNRVMDRARAMPGVTSVAAVTPLPLSGETGLMRFGLVIDGRTVPAAGAFDRVYLRWATSQYFSTIGIPVIDGRDFDARDSADAEPAAIIDAPFAARHFPGENPIGKRVRPSNMPKWRTIIGVVGAVHQTSLEEPAEPHLYVPVSQEPSPVMSLVVRTAVDPTAITHGLRDAMTAEEPTAPLYNVKTLDELVGSAVAAKRFNATSLGAFAGLASLLTAIGIYGVMATWVSYSSREIGIRMALGSTRGEVFRLVMGRAMRLSVTGVAAGLLLAIVGARAASTLLYGMTALNPAVFIIAVAVAFGTVMLAAYMPARRATRVDPSVSLRNG